jgi:hypothetical protein
MKDVKVNCWNYLHTCVFAFIILMVLWSPPPSKDVEDVLLSGQKSVVILSENVIISKY